MRVRFAGPSVVGLVAATLLVGTAGADPARVQRDAVVTRVPVTILQVTGPVSAVAQDGGRIAWLDGNCSIWIRGQVARTKTKLSDGCLWGEGIGLVGQFPSSSKRRAIVPFALGAGRVAWGGFDPGGHTAYGGVATAAAGVRPRVLKTLVWEHMIRGDFLTGVVGDGSTMLYSTVAVDTEPEDPTDCYDGPCVFTVTAWSLKRVDGRASGALRDMPCCRFDRGFGSTLRVGSRRRALSPGKGNLVRRADSRGRMRRSRSAMLRRLSW